MRHALRVYEDKYTKAIRIECRPKGGRNKNVPMWVSFLRNDIRPRSWIKRVGPRQVELRYLEQSVLVDGYIPPLGQNGRFLIDFENSEGMLLLLLCGH
jgi:hypothetical protein